MIRFIHTSDWQLGMTRHFLKEGDKERYTQARFDAIRTLGRVAKEEKCQFMLVCGDAFESNRVDRKTVARALEALKDVPVPVYILPGNHDPLNDASVYRSSTFSERRPDHVHVIEDILPICVSDGLEIVGAPWMSKRPARNPLQDALGTLSPTRETIRICMGHGGIDFFTPDKDSAGVIEVASAERAINEKKVHFVALGDRHSITKVGGSERIWYSGTPEATDFSETRSGFALVVEIDEGRVATKEVPIGQWRFVEHKVDLNTGDDVEALRKWLEELENKERSIVRLNLVGSLSLSLRSLLQNHIDAAKDLLGSLDVKEEHLLVIPDDADFTDLGFSGFVETTVQQLRNRISGASDEAVTARDALMLLQRLARGTR